MDGDLVFDPQALNDLLVRTETSSWQEEQTPKTPVPLTALR
jgi:hypothetical protein